MRTKLALVIVSGALVVGCAEDTGTTGAGGAGPSAGPLPLDELCDVFVDSLCTALIECADWSYCGLDHCRADRECEGMAALEAEIDAGWVVYDPVAAGACRDQFQANPCAAAGFLFVPDVQKVLGVCDGVLVGQQAAGDPCADEVDCQPGLECVDDACPGSCQPYKTLGEPCEIGVGARCDPSLDLECRDGACAGPWKLGDPCDALGDCGFGEEYWCDLTLGECIPAAAAGEPCDNTGQGAPRCTEGLWCDALFDVGTCQPPSGDGGPCFDDRDCSEPYTCLPNGSPVSEPNACGPLQAAGATCDSLDDCQAGLECDGDSCAPLPGLGDPCIFDCLEPLECVDGACIDPACPGEPCQSDDECSFALCDGGTCTPQTPIGGSCQDSAECTTGACQGGVCIDNTCAP